MNQVAALYVATGGCYFGLPDVDPWDVRRDARLYAGSAPVVAHPPCARWCRLAGLVEARYPTLRRGEDGGTFAAALRSVRQWGGVLEHPAFSDAWSAYDLVPPTAFGWTREAFGNGWVCEVSQTPYGHRAQKLTWLYYVGVVPPPPLNWSRPRHSARLSGCENGGKSKVAIMGKRERSASPPAFRDVLVAMARGCGGAPTGTRERR